MKAQKYSRILQAAKYYSAIDNYIKYVTDSTRRGQNVGNGTARPPSTKVYLRPFAKDLPTGQKVMQSVAQPTLTAYGASVGARTSSTAPVGEGLIIRLAGFRAARAVITTGRSGTGVAKTSKVTGMRYLDYGGKSTSIPFGPLNDTEEQATAFNTIRTAITAGAFNGSVTLRPERYQAG